VRRSGVKVTGGALVTALLGAGAWFGPMPYVVRLPGPVVDTLGRHDGRQVIAVTGAEVSTSAGQLLLTTVRVETEVGLAGAVGSWLDAGRALIPRDAVFPDGQTGRQVEQRNAELFASSQRTAEAVALRELGRPATAGKDGPVTVTIDVDDTGAVGPIAGVPQKMIGARSAGAQLFLVPEGNCAEAARNAIPGLPTARVATVGEALAALRTHAAGGTPEPCAPTGPAR
jgi:PDZ domain-containing protein